MSSALQHGGDHIKLAIRAHDLGLALAIALLTGACVAPSAPDRSPQTTGQQAARAPIQAAPKVLTLGILYEPESINLQVTGGTGGVGGAGQVFNITHDTLMVEDAVGNTFPQLAIQPPSLTDGTWRVNPDETMETTWKLRPNIKWHDGRPLTATDLAFTFQAYKDPAVPNKEIGSIAAAFSATAMDPQTLVISWSRINTTADEAKGLAPLPEHLLRAAYEQDPASLVNNPWFTTEFIGLGPYRLDTWERGALMKFVRFDDYYQGRPSLDAVIVRFTGDGNTLIANALSGAIDVGFPTGSVDPEVFVEVQRRWEGTGNEVVYSAFPSVRDLELQVRREYAEPKNGLPNRLVRQALYLALDRQEQADAICNGRCQLADSWMPPSNPLRSDVESAIPQYPRDSARAASLLAQAGWTRGPDGVLVDGPSGERFRIMIAGGLEAERESTLAAENWKALGVEPSIYTIPRALDSNETRSTLPGATYATVPYKSYYIDRLNTRYITSPANRWSGNNRTGYSNPQFDAAAEKLATTIDPRGRLPLHRQLLAEGMGDVALMPTYWPVGQTLVLNGILVVNSAQSKPARNTWNIFQWDIKR